MITSEQLDAIAKKYPNKDAYKMLAGLNLTLPQFISGNRGCMACQFYEHMVPVINPDYLTLPTSFEKSYGRYTDSYKVADADYTIIAVIPKYMNTSRFKYLYIVQNTLTKVYDVIEMSHYECLSEEQGYLRPYTEADNLVAGNIIKKGTTLYRSNNHDEYGNYRYGLNPNVAFISLAENEEDGMVISKSFYDRASFYNFNKTPITLNRNQVLLNWYGSDSIYKCFPDIGEEVKDGVLYAKRTINYSNAAAELTDNALRHIVSNDEICHGEGFVADIDVWINDRSEFEDSGNKNQILRYYSALVEYYTKVFNILDPIVNAKHKDQVQYTHKLRWIYEHARNYLDTNIQWLNNTNNFEFAYIEITTYVKKNIFNGYKITDRFGGKGVVSHIWPDEYMPRDEFGNVADIILSPPGTIARANPGQLYEQEYNFIAGEVSKRIGKLSTLEEKEALLLSFVTDSNEKEGQQLAKYLHSHSMKDKLQMFSDIEQDGIILVEEPFGGTIKLDNVEYLYNKYHITPGKVTMKREFRDNITGLPLNNAALKLTPQEDMTGLDISFIDPNSNGPLKAGVNPFDIKGTKDEYIEKQDGVVPVMTSDGKIEYHAFAHKYLEDMMSGKTFEQTMKADDSVKAEINDEGHLVRTYKSINPVVIGKKYYIVLKQNPDDKFSVRSLGTTNQVGVPNKPGRQNNLMSPYSKSAIRSGEMEQDNYYVRIDNEMVHRFIATHSTNPEMREKLATMLLTEDPMELHDLDISSEDIENDVPALEFHATLFSIGMEIRPIYEGEYDKSRLALETK